jgi:hypothetical protein
MQSTATMKKNQSKFRTLPNRSETKNEEPNIWFLWSSQQKKKKNFTMNFLKPSKKQEA